MTGAKKDTAAYIHPTSIVEADVQLGKNVHIWHYCHVRESAVLGDDVSLGKDVFIDKNVVVSQGTRIQNGVSIYNGVKIGEWVFVGPNVTFTNDRTPRAGAKLWKVSQTKLEPGCSIGAGATIVSDVTIGAFAIIGAGSVLTESIPPFHLAYGLPARIVSKICACGETRLEFTATPDDYIRDCCAERLRPEVLWLARTELDKL
jgi:UDP-2-acetamido-3-amino-2,3-dideoxy-glucuronate N-acetyltransferase